MWKKKVLTHCSDNSYGRYVYFEEAKKACEKDSNCAAIYDELCDDNGFHLCKLGYQERESSSSCIYINPAINPAGTIMIEIIIMNILQRYRNRALKPFANMLMHSFFATAFCPNDHPYAYLNGKRCCSYNDPFSCSNFIACPGQICTSAGIYFNG